MHQHSCEQPHDTCERGNMHQHSCERGNMHQHSCEQPHDTCERGFEFCAAFIFVAAAYSTLLSRCQPGKENNLITEVITKIY